MAIGTDAIIEFFGTQDALDSTTAQVVNNAFSIAGDVVQWTNDDDAPEASVVLEADFAAAPDVASVIHLHARLMNIVSTNDADVPDANNQNVYLGSFPMNDVTTVQWIPIRVVLPNNISSQVYEMYVENKTGQTLPAGWDLHVTPISKGPHG